MCTAIAYRGTDLLYGFNLDVDPAVWQFSVRKTKEYFALCVTVGKTDYLVHGVSRDGHFGNTPYMNSAPAMPPKGMRRERIDLLSDRYIRGKYSFADVEEILRTKAVVSPPAAPMHTLLGSGNGEFRIIEPGYGWKAVEERFAVLTNFPVLTGLPDYDNPFYGKARYDHAQAVLAAAGEDFSAEDLLRLLCEVRQEGQWATRQSFVWSRNRGEVLCFPDGDLSRLEVHSFGSQK